ncbi:hypothetical protein LUZ63_003657 [Rhynchospora breviuscula]|uniref:Amino acid transporter transmembrane domain-containing protein n=1 Tax=Rhynchospora breviuscula TaxID=2022672 RepID=A0A9Q0D1M7_9POAL|nr:hypothetical protein LUZ63_003657 [Rhynchospora breviuscula]
MWISSAHIITAVIGSGVLSLVWAIGQLGWVAGPAVMLLFSFGTYYTSALLSYCYQSGDPCTGKRNYTYMDGAQVNLNGIKVQICGFLQYTNIIGAALLPLDIQLPHLSVWFEILFSQISDFDQISWLSIVAAIMSFTYSTIGPGLGIVQVVANGKIKGRFTAFGDIAFAYIYSLILIEIQDMIKAPPPSEAKVMKRATIISVAVTTVVYMLCGCMGYAAFGDAALGNLLIGFGFYNPFWLLDIANAAIVIHLVGAYQVYFYPLFAFVEKWALQTWPKSQFITKEITIPLGSTKSYNLNLFRLTWRSIFVVITTVISMLMPFFNDVVGFLGALGFWPLTVYFSSRDVHSSKEGTKMEHTVGLLPASEPGLFDNLSSCCRWIHCWSCIRSKSIQALQNKLLICERHEVQK